MLFFVIFGIMAFIVFSGVVCTAIIDPVKGIGKNAAIVMGAGVMAFAIAAFLYFVLMV